MRLRKYGTASRFGAAILGFLITLSSYAGIGTSLMQGASLTPVGHYSASFHSDFIFNNGGGVNLSGHFRTGLIHDFFDIGVFVGTGKTNFQAGANTKFNFLPDLPGQVGLSFLGGISLFKDDLDRKTKDTFMALHTAIIVSKNFVTTFGDLNPYTSFQLEAVFLEGDTIYPLSAILGLEWKLNATAPFNLFTEAGFNIQDSLSMFAAGASYEF